MQGQTALDSRASKWACHTMLASYGVSLAALTGALPHIRAALASGLASMGVVFALAQMTFVIGSLTSGFVVRHLGWRRAISIGAFVMACGTGLIAFPQSYPGLLLACSLMGAGGGLLSPQVNGFLSSLDPGREARVVSATQVSFGIGAIVGIALAGLGGELSLWRWAFALSAMGGLGTGLLLLTQVFLDTRGASAGVPNDAGSTSHPPSPTRRGPAAGWMAGLQPTARRAFITACVAMLLYSTVEVSFWGWLPSYLQEVMGGWSSLSAVTSIGFWTVFTAGRAATPYFSSRMGEVRLLLTAGLAAMLCLLAFSVSSGSAVTVVLSVFLAMSMASIWPTLVAYVAKACRGAEAHALGVIVACGGLGGVVGPAAVGFLAESIGLQGVVRWLLVPGMAMLLCLRVLPSGLDGGRKALSQRQA